MFGNLTYAASKRNEISDLRSLLENYSSSKVYLFPDRHGLGHIHPDSADRILHAAFLELGIEGASTQNFRHTCLTKMHMYGVPLKVIQKISGHKTLGWSFALVLIDCRAFPLTKTL